MNILVSGASGFIGKNLVQHLRKKGHKVSIIKHQDFLKPTSHIMQRLEGKDAVINLSGYPILKRWTSKNKALIYRSRVDTTQTIVDAIKRMDKKPSVFISTSAVGIYKSNRKNTEENPSFDKGFLARVCIDWENAAKSVPKDTRLVIFRLGLVLGRGGALKQMIIPFRLGLGGKIGSGKQSFPWVHIDDVVAAYAYALENEKIKDAYNLVAPEYINNEAFSKALAKALKRPSFMTIPAFALKILFGKAATVLLSGQQVYPLKLIQDGFKFKYSDIQTALNKTV